MVAGPDQANRRGGCRRRGVWPANRRPASASLCRLAKPREVPGVWTEEGDSKGAGVALGRKGQASSAPTPAASCTRRSVLGLLLSPGAGLPQADTTCGLGRSLAAASQSPCAAQLRTAPTSWHPPSGPRGGHMSPGQWQLRARRGARFRAPSPASWWPQVSLAAGRRPQFLVTWASPQGGLVP